MARKNNGTEYKGKELSAVARNIRKRREELGLEQRELSKRLEVSPSAVGNWETGYSKPSLDILVSVCSVLGITLYELFGLKEPSVSCNAREQKMMADYQELSEDHKIAVDNLIFNLRRAEVRAAAPDITRLICFSKQLAAGIGDPADIDDMGEPIYLYSSELIDRADYVFTVNGESMEPEYHNGDMVLVRKAPECGAIHPGEVGAFMIHNEAYIKEYQTDGLHSYNKKYSPIRAIDEYGAAFIGKVIGIIDESDMVSEHDRDRYIKANENDHQDH